MSPVGDRNSIFTVVPAIEQIGVDAISKSPALTWTSTTVLNFSSSSSRSASVVKYLGYAPG